MDIAHHPIPGAQKNMSFDESVSHWIDQVRTGDSLAAQQIWQRYYERLVQRARLQLNKQKLPVSDEEDVAISVFESFYRAAREGRIPDLADRDSLWRLLLKMTARKIIDKRRHDNRLRRGGNHQTISLHSPKNDDIIEIVGEEPTPEFVATMVESCDLLMEHLGDDSLKFIAYKKMEGYSNRELAAELNCSERTIERRLNLIREKCNKELLK